jgi:deoxycytidylate deaminase
MFQAFCNASQSKAFRRKTGALILKEISSGYFQPLSSGCNGTRPGMSNKCEDKEGKSYIDQVVHAERNCLKKMQQEGIATKGCIAVVTFIPCNECSYDLIDAGIVEIYYCEESTSCVDKTHSLKSNLEKHGLYVQHVPKSRMHTFSNNMRVGFLQDKFMGQNI